MNVGDRLVADFPSPISQVPQRISQTTTSIVVRFQTATLMLLSLTEKIARQTYKSIQNSYLKSVKGVP